MIKIEDCQEIQEERIECDLYVPINIEFGKKDTLNEPIIYWRTGDFCRSLLEIGVGKNNKKLRSITLVSCKKTYNQEYMFKRVNNVKKGCPILEFDFMDNEFKVDEKGSLNVFIGHKSVSVLLSDEEVESCIINQNIVFYLNNCKRLVGFHIKEIDENNMKILLKSL